MTDRVPAMMPVAVCMASAVSAVAVLCRHGWGLVSCEYLAFGVVLLRLTQTDLASRTIPNRCIGAAVAIRASFLFLVALHAGWPAAASEFASSAAGVLVLGGSLLLLGLVGRALSGGFGMGGGDVKLLCVAGLYFGAGGGVLVVLASCAAGICAAAVMSARAGIRRETCGPSHGFLRRTLPFGPAIALGCVVAMLAEPLSLAGQSLQL